MYGSKKTIVHYVGKKVIQCLRVHYILSLYNFFFFLFFCKLFVDFFLFLLLTLDSMCDAQVILYFQHCYFHYKWMCIADRVVSSQTKKYNNNKMCINSVFIYLYGMVSFSVHITSKNNTPAKKPYKRSDIAVYFFPLLLLFDWLFFISFHSFP